MSNALLSAGFTLKVTLHDILRAQSAMAHAAKEKV